MDCEVPHLLSQLLVVLGLGGLGLRGCLRRGDGTLSETIAHVRARGDGGGLVGSHVASIERCEGDL